MNSDAALIKEVEREAWERMPGESSRAYEAFTAYRDLGARRSIRIVAEQLQKSHNALLKMSQTYHWVDRCAAWADFQELESRRQRIEDIREMNDRHKSIAKMLQAKALEKLQAMAGQKDLSPTQVSQYIDLAVKVERLAMGAPDSIQEQRVTDEGEAPGRISRAILGNPETLEKALGMLDEVAKAESDEQRRAAVERIKSLEEAPAPV